MNTHMTIQVNLVDGQGHQCSLCDENVPILTKIEAGDMAPFLVCRHCMESGDLEVFIGELMRRFLNMAKALSGLLNAEAMPDWDQLQNHSLNS